MILDTGNLECIVKVIHGKIKQELSSCWYGSRHNEQIHTKIAA